MTHAIAIEGINLYGYHGCLDEEGKIGGNYIVDVYMTTDFSAAVQSDELGDTIDYCTVYEIARAEVAQRNKLIEPVADRIYKRLRAEFPTLKTLHVKLTKLLPPIGGDVEKVCVEIKD